RGWALTYGRGLVVRRATGPRDGRQWVEAGVSNKWGTRDRELTSADRGARAAELLAPDDVPAGTEAGIGPGATVQGPVHSAGVRRFTSSPPRLRARAARQSGHELQPQRRVWPWFAQVRPTRRQLQGMRSAGMAARRWLTQNAVGSPRLPERWRSPAIGYALAAVLEILATLLTLVLV